MQYLAQRFAARANEHQVLVQLFEHGAEDEQLLGQVVDDEDVGALVRQGAASFQLWTGVEAPLETMRAAIKP